MKKLRFVSLLLVLTMLIPFAVSGAEGEMPFRDVKEGKWYYKSVKYVYERDLMQGVAKDRFDPNGSLTRAMFVTILCRIHGGEKKNTDDFSDVKPGKWYSGYVGWAASTGVVNGYSDGTFKPDANITRQEIATAMVRYIDYSGKNLPRRATAPSVFADSSKVAKWAKDHVETLRRAGVVNGDNNGNFNPKSNVTRAEVAQMIKNLLETEELAWQGYLPDPEKDGWAVYGAKYLWSHGPALQEKLRSSLEESEGYPAVRVYDDGGDYGYDLHGPGTPWRSYEPSRSWGFSPTALVADLSKTPVVKICYSLDGADLPEAYVSNRTTGEWSYTSAPLVFEKGADDGGYATATCDVTEAVSTLSDVSYGTGSGANIHVMFRPFAEGASLDLSFRVRYIGLFPDREAADSFTSEGLRDYLMNYSLYSDVKIKEADSATVDEYLAKARDRIAEIRSTPSAVTPADIEAQGGVCYYVSSIHGDDSNDGLTPETPWASPEAMFTYRAGPRLYLPKLKKGDAVFFERGSEFYPGRYFNNTISTMNGIEGVTYGAYGDDSKPKPVFYGSFDFGGGTGNWKATEWENIYEIDLRDCLPVETFNYLPEGEREAKRDHFISEAGDIGNIIFNGGQYKGVRVFPNVPEDSEVREYPYDEWSPDHIADPFGEGKTTKRMYQQGNCAEYFISGGTTCLDPGDALRNNLEFMHDWSRGKVFLRCNWGDPKEVFDRIDLCRGCNIFFGSKVKRIDNLCFLCSGYIAVDLGEGGMDVTNCEAGYAGGSYSSVGTGIGGYGRCEYMRVDNCYIHDVEDGPMGTQFTADIEGVEMNNVILTNNVIATSQNLVELFSTKRVMGEDGLGKNKIRNAVVRDNMALYLGYGYPRCVEGKAEGLAVHNWYYGEMVDCVLSGNTMFCCNGAIIGAHVASDGNSRGWHMYDNTYVMDPRVCAYLRGIDGVTYTNLNKSFYASYNMPFDERFIKYFTSVGIDTTSEFYVSNIANDAELDEYFVTTGYYIERGIPPLGTD